MPDPRTVAPVYDIHNREAARTNPAAAHRVPEPEVVLDNDQVKAIVAEQRPPSTAPLIAYQVRPDLLVDHPILAEHGPSIVAARDHLAAVELAIADAHRAADEQREAHKAAETDWRTKFRATLARGERPPEAPASASDAERRTATLSAQEFRYAREQARATLTAAVIAEGPAVIDANLAWEHEQRHRLLTKRLPSSLAKAAEPVLDELRVLAPLLDHIRSIVNRSRKTNGETVDTGRCREAAVANLLGGGVL